jgi:hypothetical protein
MKKVFCFLILCSALCISIGCAAKKSAKFVRQALPKGASIGIIVDSPNNIKNVIVTKFLEKGFKVKAVNASDLYTLKDSFTIADYKYLAYEKSEIILGNEQDAITSTQKSYDSIYKLHVYNYEANKAEILAEMKAKWGLRFLIILDLKDWQNVSWFRAIDLDTYDLVAVENYPTKFSDKIDTVIDHFIETLNQQQQ